MSSLHLDMGTHGRHGQCRSLLLHAVVTSCVLLYSITSAQSCIGGSLYEIPDETTAYPISIGSWYLNVYYPSTCSGSVVEYSVRYYHHLNGISEVYLALWVPQENNTEVYEIIESSIVRITVFINDKKRNAEGFRTIMPANVYARKGAVVGAYFSVNMIPLYVLGRLFSSTPSPGRSVCTVTSSTLETGTLNCGATNTLDNVLLHAVAQVVVIQCIIEGIPIIPNGNISIIDPDLQYGARAQYICHHGYRIANGANSLLQCDRNAEWAGSVPMCEVITSCEPPITEINNGLVMGPQSSTVGSKVMFYCDRGYTLVGSPAVTCLPTGYWNDSIPVCVAMETTPPSTTMKSRPPQQSLTIATTSTLNISTSTNININILTSATPISRTLSSTLPLYHSNTISPSSTTTIWYNSSLMSSNHTIQYITLNTTSSSTSTVPVEVTVTTSTSTTSQYDVIITSSSNSSINSGGDTSGESQLFMTTTIVSIMAVFLVIIIVLITCVIVIVRYAAKKTREVRQLVSGAEDKLNQSFRKRNSNLCNPVYQGRQLGTITPLEYETAISARDTDGYFRMEPSDITSSTILTDSGDHAHFEFDHAHQPVPVQPERIYETCEEIETVIRRQQEASCSGYEMFVPTREQRHLMQVNGNDERYLDRQYFILHESTLPLPGHHSSISEGFFTEDSVYWEPGSDTSSLYEQLARKKYREIPRHLIRISHHLGSGQFGTVHKGLWITSSGVAQDVAVKTLKGLATAEEEVMFLQEAAINGQFHHCNVVRLCGVVTVGQPTMIVLEYLPNGDLKCYLEGKKPMPGELVDDSLPDLLVNFSHQIANGMLYLSQKKFIHRDLAARNILVGNNDICKIADFGMSRQLQDKTYYKSSSRKVPVRWTAPEAIHFKKYSTQSDIWSYGAVLYEIWSLGCRPFQKYTNQECIKLIDEGYRLSPPHGCTRAVYEVMISCWHPDPLCRPSFGQLTAEFSRIDDHVAECRQLKAQLGCSNEIESTLYEDLQTMYLNN